MSEYLKDGNFNIYEMRKLDFGQQEELCQEIRDKIIKTVKENGGHLASNLGVCELTVGLYNVFDPFKDRIVWDVGHQAYTHKILTGRNEGFETLRKQGGISGFPKRSESPADAFDTGHSSTSISAALGILRAGKITGEEFRTVAVIGDGAMTGGEAFEALNDCAERKDDLIVVLNDNGMSISKNVGGLARYLGRIRTSTSYIKLKKGIKKFLSAIPKVGPFLIRKISRFKLSFKILLVPGEFFEMLGYVYIGPVDGHSIPAVTDAMKKAAKAEGPVIVHVITKKGMGYKMAEESPEKYHGLPENAPGAEDEVSFSGAFSSALCKMAGEDEKISAISAAMTTGTKLDEFRKLYPERFYDVGIAEQHAMTLCFGMSSAGARPYLVLYSTFAQRAFDQLIHDGGIPEIPAVIGLDRGGAAGRDGETHQGIYDISFLRCVPNITLMAPSNAAELEDAVRFSKGVFEGRDGIRKGPFIIRYPAKGPSGKNEPREPLKYGRSVKVAGDDLAKAVIICLGPLLYEGMEAANKLNEEGFSVSCINARFAIPQDREGLADLTKAAELVITVEDGVIPGGFGEAVKCFLEGRKVINLGYPAEAVRQDSVSNIHIRYGLCSDNICRMVREHFGGSQNET